MQDTPLPGAEDNCIAAAAVFPENLNFAEVCDNELLVGWLLATKKLYLL